MCQADISWIDTESTAEEVSSKYVAYTYLATKQNMYN